MSDNAILPNRDPNPLAGVLVATIRELSEARRQLEDAREALRVAVSVIAERDKEVDRQRANNLHLRAQLRAAVSGRTIAEERADAEREALDDWRAAA